MKIRFLLILVVLNISVISGFGQSEQTEPVSGYSLFDIIKNIIGFGQNSKPKEDIDEPKEVPKEHPLFVAIENKDAKAVSNLLRRGQSPNIYYVDQNKYQITPLIYASKLGLSNIVKILLDNPKININQTDGKRHTALFYAVYKGNSDIVETLVDFAINKYGATDNLINFLGVKDSDTYFGYKDTYLWDLAEILTESISSSDLYGTAENYRSIFELLWSTLMNLKYLKKFLENGVIPENPPSNINIDYIRKGFSEAEKRLLSDTIDSILSEQKQLKAGRYVGSGVLKII